MTRRAALQYRSSIRSGRASAATSCRLSESARRPGSGESCRSSSFSRWKPPLALRRRDARRLAGQARARRIRQRPRLAENKQAILNGEMPKLPARFLNLVRRRWKAARRACIDGNRGLSLCGTKRSPCRFSLSRSWSRRPRTINRVARSAPRCSPISF